MKKIINKLSLLIAFLLVVVLLIRVDARGIDLDKLETPFDFIILGVCILVTIIFVIVIPLVIRFCFVSNYSQHRGFFKQFPKQYFSDDINGRISHKGKNASGIDISDEEMEDRIDRFYYGTVLTSDLRHARRYRELREQESYRIREEQYLKNQMKVKEREHQEELERLNRQHQKEIENIKKEYGQLNDDAKQNQEDVNSDKNDDIIINNIDDNNIDDLI